MTLLESQYGKRLRVQTQESFHLVPWFTRVLCPLILPSGNGSNGSCIMIIERTHCGTYILVSKERQAIGKQINMC